MIIGIVAVDRNLAIGKGGKLPWHYSADMKFFKATTIGNTVVMGRRTWETLKRPLKERTNIVLSREKNFHPGDSVLVMRDVDAVLEFARGRDEHLFVMGGAKVYEAFLRHIDRWIVTEVPLSVEGADTFMPPNFLDGFEMYELRQLDEGLRVKFYERSAALPPMCGKASALPLSTRLCRPMCGKPPGFPIHTLEESCARFEVASNRAQEGKKDASTFSLRFRSSPKRHDA